MDLIGVGERATGSAGIGAPSEDAGVGEDSGVGALMQTMRSAEGVRKGRRKRRNKVFLNIHTGKQAAGGFEKAI
jgi:hypothetical protein